jgi:flagellar motor switch protein FliN/FliY
MADQAPLEQTIDAATRAVSVQAAQLEELTAAPGKNQPLGLQSLMEVPVRVTVEVGRAQSTLARLVQLAPGSIVVLDRAVHEPADVLVNGKVVARGEVVVVDGAYGIRVSSIEKTEV